MPTPTMPCYDAIVLGTGGVGSAALLALARRGVKAIGIDRFDPPHDCGSSHGQTRVTRQAYFEHPDYVPLVRESYRWWEELEQLAGRKLYHQVGLLEVGPADGIVVPGVLRAARAHQLAVEQLSAAEAMSRWPEFAVPEGLTTVYEQQAGYLLVEDCVAAHLMAARRLGAELKTGCEVRNWTVQQGQVTVHTSDGAFSGERLIIAAGAWAKEILHSLALPLRILRKSLFWFGGHAENRHALAGLPVFLFELPAGILYGFPQLDERGIKVGQHSGGQPLDDPLALDRDQFESDRQMLASFLADHLPTAGQVVTDHTVCMYTMTGDEHFVVDRHPAFENVVFAAGLSGHGFKFTGVLGQALSELALDGRSDLPIGFLSLARLQRR